MLHENVFLGGCPVIRPEGIYYDGRRVIRLGLSGPTVTWVEWYNSANADDQAKFDEDAVSLNDASTTAEQKQNFIDVFGGSDAEKAALRNYVLTGGRAALFAAPAKNYGTKPIAVVKPGGPIESAPNGQMLHPGTYTYSNVTKGGVGFDEWVQANAKTVKNVVVQASASVLPGGVSYYTDNLITVYQDTLWPSTLNGLPTWLPPGTDAVKYWGKVTPPAPPDWDAITPSKDTIHWGVAAFAVAAVVVGGALLVYYVPRREPERAPRPEPLPAYR